MNDEAKIAHLKKLCSTDEWRQGLKAPFLVTVDGEAWSMASDGRLLFAWRGALEGVEVRRDAPRIPKEWITKALAASGATTAEALRDWAGPAKPSAVKDCSTCKGTGESTKRHRCSCEYCEVDEDITVDCLDCDGEGEVLTEEVRYGTIGSTVVNRNFFALVLEGIDGTVCVDPGAELYDQVRLRGDGWFALVMPVNRDGLKPDEIDGQPGFQV